MCLLLTRYLVFSKDAYAKYKTELDGLYALGEPSSSGSKL